MNMKLIVYTLKNCSQCKRLLDYLDTTTIDYENRTCYGVSKECDDLEDMVNCITYPIVEIQTTDYRGITQKEYIITGHDPSISTLTSVNKPTIFSVSNVEGIINYFSTKK